MKLSTAELVEIIKSFRSVDYYETFEFLLNFIKLTNENALDLLIKVYYRYYYLNHFYLISRVLISKPKTPTTKQKQTSQLNIFKKLFNYSSVKNYIKSYDFIPLAIYSLNIPLVDFLIKELHIILCSW